MKSQSELTQPPARSPSLHPIGNRLLASLPSAEQEAIRPFLTRVRLVAGQVLIEQGRAPDEIFFIEEGLASLLADSGQGRPLDGGVQVAMIGREGIVGSLAMLDGNSPAIGCTVMQIAGRALRIPAAALRSLLQDCPALQLATSQFIQSLTRQVMTVAAGNARSSLAERCVVWLLMADQRIDDDLIITHESLANLLGLRRSGVTVTTVALHRTGLIQASRGRIRLIDRASLSAIARGELRLAPDGSLVGSGMANAPEATNENQL